MNYKKLQDRINNLRSHVDNDLTHKIIVDVISDIEVYYQDKIEKMETELITIKDIEKEKHKSWFKALDREKELSDLNKKLENETQELKTKYPDDIIKTLQDLIKSEKEYNQNANTKIKQLKLDKEQLEKENEELKAGLNNLRQSYNPKTGLL